MKYSLYLFLSLLIVASACNDSVLVGSELLESEELDVTYIDSLVISAKTIEGDSSVTFRKLDQDGYSTTSYMVGSIADSEFGAASSTTYFTPTIIATYPDFATKPLDSVVMVLTLDSLSSYGDRSAVHDLTLSVLKSRMDGKETYYSNLEFEAEETPFYETSRTINYKDSLLINNYVQDTLITIEPHLRFKLENDYWEQLASGMDSLTEGSLLEIIPGFELKSSPSSNSMMGINLDYENSGWASDIIFYYNSTDTSKAVYRLPLGKYRHSNFTTDYTGSQLESNLDRPDAACLYLQSQAGTDISVDLSSIENVSDMILNFGELELTVKSFDEALYPPVEAISAWYKNDEGELTRVQAPEDITRVVETYPNGEALWNYKIDLTAHLNSLSKKLIDSTELFIFAVSKSERANRSLIYGASDPDHPLKLNLILTKP